MRTRNLLDATSEHFIKYLHFLINRISMQLENTRKILDKGSPMHVCEYA